jgi:hypothetical protein
MMLPASRVLLKGILLCFLCIPRSVFGQNETLCGEFDYVIASDAAGGGKDFGSAVAISATTMIVGDAYYSSDSGVEGRVYVYSKNGNEFEEDQVLLDPDETANKYRIGCRFGRAIDIHDDTILIGAPCSRAAYAFFRTVGGWELQQRLTPSDGGVDFDESVAVNGDRIVVGAWSDSSSAHAAYVFERNGTSWTETQILTPSDNPDSRFFRVDVE